MAIVKDVLFVSPLSEVLHNISAAFSSGLIDDVPASDALEVRVSSVVHQVFNGIKLVFTSGYMQRASSILVLDVWPEKTSILEQLERQNISLICSIVLSVLI